jgi:hypothetical protein
MHKVSHAWLYGSVKPYFEKQGIKLLRDDMLFIEKCLSNIPQNRHRIVMRDYLAIWNTNIADKESDVKTGLNPRYEANMYLRNTAGLRKSD